jgi:hypothetical protein
MIQVKMPQRGKSPVAICQDTIDWNGIFNIASEDLFVMFLSSAWV